MQLQRNNSFISTFTGDARGAIALQQNYSFIAAILRGGVMRYSYGTLRDRLLKIEIEYQKRRYDNYYKISS
ncbi:MAG: hypothetical protein RMX68_008190 [Aulosira sp. ZfuVER01]|nr:hypothetical protein [Aulosira sp. ZfuVER01]MDZ7997625.1 hypothetical protein [Aulosira sp. DedVER01a]MDZ8054627.1 hypothetical protein [Aulosira sp. ZfuCHP01]